MQPEFKELSEAVGSEVFGVNLALPLIDATFKAIRSAFHERGVLLFRNQHLDEEQHIAFSRRFGELEIHIAKQYLHENYPEIAVLSNKVVDGKALGIQDAGRFWHSDLSYMQRPSLGSILYAHEVPPRTEGGQTPYAGMYAAYDALEDDMKNRLKSLKAIHSYEQRWQKDAERGMQRAKLDEKDRNRLSPVAHPIIRRHPITGRPALYINEGFTVAVEGMPEAESRALLNDLFAHSTQADFVYTHQWQANDLIMWDNACVIHSASWYNPDHIRHMHRTTIAGPACTNLGA